ncbi:MAG: 50S ribosome-binding GTPase [Phycisphaerae bacterium]|nr:50S ribosome-binding GTPase [Phycisphaerae bacterium]
MQAPLIDDSIVAVSSGWQSTPIGIIRLSGPNSFELLRRLGTTPAADRPAWTSARLRLDSDQTLPATVFWFSAPRSYTGQDVVEVHTVGCLPLLRELSARLIEMGARRALPGEFTARAFILGKLDARQVEGVLGLMQSEHEAVVRQAARLTRGRQRRLADDLAERSTGLLALIEAGIDFVEEEDIRFISPAEVVQELDTLLAELDRAALGSPDEPLAGQPHIALVGLPNAGKSTLFNSLLGTERALVSPVLGTTRDVLSAEIELGGHRALFQDCAGLGSSAADLEIATHLAAERTARQADLVLWIHAADAAWDDHETASCRQLSPERLLLVWSKVDLAAQHPPDTIAATFEDIVEVSVKDDIGLSRLRALLTARLDRLARPGAISASGTDLLAVSEALRRARVIAAQQLSDMQSPELVALELRVACDLLASAKYRPIDEDILARVFSQFCVGK